MQAFLTGATGMFFKLFLFFPAQAVYPFVVYLIQDLINFMLPVTRLFIVLMVHRVVVFMGPEIKIVYE